MTQLTVFLRHAKRSNNKELDLSKKELASIPKQVFTIRAIEVLILSDNKIAVIQPAIAELFRLKILNIQNNCIVELPQQIMSLPKLTTLSVSNNPLDKKFQELLKTKNQTVPQLLECLQNCFEQKKIQASKTPAWLMQHESKQLTVGKSISLNQQQISWDQTIFKSDKKIAPPKTSQGRRVNNNLKNQNSLMQSQNYEPESTFKNNILEINFADLDIFQQISMGGFSTIHRAQYKDLQIIVKKVFNPNINQELLQQFNNQLSMISKYRHPKIVLLIGAVTTPPNLCIVMEYVKNGTLYDLIHKRKSVEPLSEKNKKDICLQLCQVFLYLHNHGIVHRDIKSHNVLLQSQGEGQFVQYRIKLCDFGLARHKNDLNSGPLQFCGTSTYMAQQLFLKKAYDETVDIFALGTLFYEVYAGEVPYAGMDPGDIKQKVLKNSQLPYKISIKKSVLQIINKCRAQEPKMRPNLKQLLKFGDW